MSYKKGLNEISEGVYAWLQPDGSWGWSNAGLIVDGGASLLVDTLFDLPLTQTMLDAMSRVEPSVATLDTVVNTHANGDHCWGNQLVGGAEIIATRACAEEMTAFTPKTMHLLSRVARLGRRMGPLRTPLARVLSAIPGLNRSPLPAVLEASPYVFEIFGGFDFSGIDLTLPTRTFEGQLTLQVGELDVVLQDVGPAHTRSDVLVHIPERRVVYTGDILFIGGHPIVWEGPISNWIRACDTLLEMDVDVIVPGHGPLTDHEGVRSARDYLAWLVERGSELFAQGLSEHDAAALLLREVGCDWTESERLAVNVNTLYRELRGDTTRVPPAELFARMARLRRLS